MGTPTVLQLLTGFGLEEDGVKIWDSFEIGLVLSILVVSQMSPAKRLGESGMLLMVIYEIKSVSLDLGTSNVNPTKVK